MRQTIHVYTPLMLNTEQKKQFLEFLNELLFRPGKNEHAFRVKVNKTCKSESSICCSFLDHTGNVTNRYCLTSPLIIKPEAAQT